MHCANCALIPYGGFSQIRSQIAFVSNAIQMKIPKTVVSKEEDAYISGGSVSSREGAIVQAQLRPPRAKYTYFWTVDQVLSHLSSCGENRSLSLQKLSWKLAMLLALCSASCSSDLGKLRISHHVWSTHKVVFHPVGLAELAIYQLQLNSQYFLIHYCVLSDVLEHTSQLQLFSESSQTKTNFLSVSISHIILWFPLPLLVGGSQPYVWQELTPRFLSALY